MSARALALALALGAAAWAGPGAAHNGVDHDSAAEAAAHAAAQPDAAHAAAQPDAAAAPVGAPTPFPSRIGGPYALIDQHGRARTERDPDGRAQLVFFGYVSCPSICAVALPRMAQTVDLLRARGIAATPVLITVDPAHDTPEAMRAAAPGIHPDLIGLTGTPDALAEAYAAFQVESKEVSRTLEGAPIYAHGSFIYLMGADGAFHTLLPPILGPERMADVAARYLAPEAADARR